MVGVCISIHLCINVSFGFGFGFLVDLMNFTVGMINFRYKYEDTEPLFVGIASVFLSLILDITYLSIYGDGIVNAPAIGHSITGVAKFSAAMTIMALLIKPWTIFVSLREFSRRGGDIKAYIPFAPGVGGSQGGYTGIPDGGEAPLPSAEGGGQPAGIDAVPF